MRKCFADDKQVLQFARYFTILKPLLLKTSPTAFVCVCVYDDYGMNMKIFLCGTVKYRRSDTDRIIVFFLLFGFQPRTK